MNYTLVDIGIGSSYDFFFEVAWPNYREVGGNPSPISALNAAWPFWPYTSGTFGSIIHRLATMRSGGTWTKYFFEIVPNLAGCGTLQRPESTSS
jgi:hypothetical protein